MDNITTETLTDRLEGWQTDHIPVLVRLEGLAFPVTHVSLSYIEAEAGTEGNAPQPVMLLNIEPDTDVDVNLLIDNGKLS